MLDPVAELLEIAAELSEDRDRPAAIVAGCLVEECLAEALSKTISLERDQVDDKYPKLAHKIDGAFKHGLIMKEEKDDLHWIRKIRNLFAHKSRIRTFKDPEVIAFCELMHFRNSPHCVLKEDYRFVYMERALGIEVKLGSLWM